MNNGRKFPKKFASEYCILLSGQKPKVEKDRHKAEMIRASAESAPERLKQICNMVENETLFPQHVQDFGVKLDKKPMEAEGMCYIETSFKNTFLGPMTRIINCFQIKY